MDRRCPRVQLQDASSTPQSLNEFVSASRRPLCRARPRSPTDRKGNMDPFSPPTADASHEALCLTTSKLDDTRSPTRALRQSGPSEKTDKHYKPRQISQDVASARPAIEFQPQSAAPSAHAQHLWQFTERSTVSNAIIQVPVTHNTTPQLSSPDASSAIRPRLARIESREVTSRTLPCSSSTPARPRPTRPAKNRYPRAGFHARIGSLLEPLE
ncbi:hypothetical protein BKA56DRAFT_715348 [Ilyonectria sp. MPI-CAGE-AT-0026]|nr:hypothetical protein BKA56DRAFT_715348 [Ilyonectria sp. MPI-CAGE-AT-0026]